MTFWLTFLHLLLLPLLPLLLSSTPILRDVQVLASDTIPEHVPGTAVDRQCGSAQQAIHFAAQAVMSGVQDVVIAAGTYGFR